MSKEKTITVKLKQSELALISLALDSAQLDADELLSGSPHTVEELEDLQAKINKLVQEGET